LYFLLRVFDFQTFFLNFLTSSSLPPVRRMKKYYLESAIKYLGRYSASSTHLRRVLERRVQRISLRRPSYDKAAALQAVEAVSPPPSLLFFFFFFFFD